MIVRTKKFQVNKGVYIKKGFLNLLIEQWWISLIYLAICSIHYLWIPSIWWIIGASIGLVLYLLFWLIQFIGLTQLEQGKYMFERLSYEISSNQILMKINTKQGMPIKWDTVKKVKIQKDGFLFKLNKVQLILFPFKVFNSDNEIRFVKSILNRKGYVSY
ncbi:MAG: YcxB family protein [Bacteroidota bacterium]|nr:YcxB family protein [Bacteroidota bacterium]|tara:strand:+ start:77 stop:556 length:480 start_codon:yes stop_codon:yes gene_type:complete